MRVNFSPGSACWPRSKRRGPFSCSSWSRSDSREAFRAVAAELERPRDRHVGADAGERLEYLLLRLVEAGAERADGDDETDADAEAEGGQQRAALAAPKFREGIGEVEHGASIRCASKSGRESRIRIMKNPLPAAAWLILLLALLLRVGYMAATPDYKLVHDALDYDHAATSIARGDGWPYSRRPGRETAFRPPAYPVLLAGVYKVAGVERRERARPRRPGAHPRDRHRDADRRPDRAGRPAAVGTAGRAHRDGRRGDLHPADPRRRGRDVRAAVRRACCSARSPPRSSTGARRTAGAGCCSRASSAG